VRGKLRDKRADSKRDSFKRDLQMRRRPARRSTRNPAWLNEPYEGENNLEALQESESQELVVENSR
jgi:hypothetical protein